MDDRELNGVLTGPGTVISKGGMAGGSLSEALAVSSVGSTTSGRLPEVA